MCSKILLIEDEDNVRETIDLLLTTAGYQVRASATGKNIFEIIGDFNPDLILLDILLDGVDGRDICRDIKANSMTASVPVIILSAVPEIYNAIMDVGANDIVSKPFEGSVLLSRIERQLLNAKVPKM
ncbi:response regulator [Pedobacter sp. SYSU D00535]|uniref:response regulator n=1 Tax=Pedobacter sp. SYSU D00535 TaxID=2810308 RepID=UPI001A979A5E|nr:response regulator [Pedobacter sp. SYSU D00535]